MGKPPVRDHSVDQACQEWWGVFVEQATGVVELPAGAMWFDTHIIAVPQQAWLRLPDISRAAASLAALCASAGELAASDNCAS